VEKEQNNYYKSTTHNSVHHVIFAYNMAFFGLTALGYQNTFAVASRTASNLHVFNETDFRTAWRKVMQDEKVCRSDDLQTIFRSLFHGPVPLYDAELLSQSFDGGSEEVAFDDYIQTMISLSEFAEAKEQENAGKISDQCDMSTSSEFEESIRRNKRLPRELQQKQAVPLTSTQEVIMNNDNNEPTITSALRCIQIGWEKQDLRAPVAGREGSHITKFAAELVKNGIYY
jgi:hypothetical protein